VLYVGRLLAGALLITGALGCQPKRVATIAIDDFIEKANAEGDTDQADRAIDLTRLKAQDSPGSDYQLGSGDLLTATIYRLEQADAPSIITVRVDDTGNIALPLIGEIQAAGRRPDQLETDIKNKLTPKFIRNPRVTVVVASYRQFSVLVLGAVNNPGRVLLRRDQRNVVHALSAAGGLTDVSSGQIVLRPAVSPDLHEIYQIETEEGFNRAMARKPLQEGDIIVAKQDHLPVIYIHGLVHAPGAIQIPRHGVSVLQAMVAAGGLPREFNADLAYLTRRFKDGTEHSVELDLHQLAQGEIPNLTMRPGDVLEVPHTDKTRTAEFVKENLIFRAGIDATFTPWPYFLTPKVQVNDGNDNVNLNAIIRQDLALRGVRKLTEPLGF
jgi:polysaccharide export outer membrane protein